MACYKARGFLQKAESLGLTALGLGQLGSPLVVRTFKARRVGGPFCCAAPLHSAGLI